MLIQSSLPVKMALHEFVDIEGLDTGEFGNVDGMRAKVGSPVTGKTAIGITVDGLCVGLGFKSVKPENKLHVLPWEIKIPSQPSLFTTLFPPLSIISFGLCENINLSPALLLTKLLFLSSMEDPPEEPTIPFIAELLLNSLDSIDMSPLLKMIPIFEDELSSNIQE